MLVYAVAWIILDRERFDFNAVATLIVWLMTLFISRFCRRDTLAIQAKLDELLRSDENARPELWVIRATAPIRRTRSVKRRHPAPSEAVVSTRVTPTRDRAAISIAGRAPIE